jgi:HTH-type transcriptional regulator/antitoxin HigA
MPRTTKTTAKYFALVRRFPLRPIRSEKELDRAIEVIHSLVVRDRIQEEDDYLDVLSDLVEQYEDIHYPMGPVSDAAMLQSLIEAKGITAEQVSRATKIPRATLSAILNGKRLPTRDQVAKLSKYFKVPRGLFLSSGPVFKIRQRKEC